MPVCGRILVTPLMGGEVTDQGANLARAGRQLAFEVGDAVGHGAVKLVHGYSSQDAAGDTTVRVHHAWTSGTMAKRAP